MGQAKGQGQTAMMAGGMEESTSSADTASAYQQAKTKQAKSSPNLYNPLQPGKAYNVR